jgi:hypothetical protein
MDARLVAQALTTDGQRHHDLFERRVPRALADAVDGALDLPRTGLDRRHRVGDGQTQVVMTVGAQHALVQAGYSAQQRREDEVDLVWERVAHRVGNVDRARARLDRGRHHLRQEIEIGARRVLGAELDVVAVAEREPHGLARLIDALLARDAQLLLQVDVGRRNEHVDARALGRLQGSSGGLDVWPHGAGQRRDDRPAHILADRAYRFGVLRRACGEPGLEDVDTEIGELVREPKLLRSGHAAAGRLLTIPERRVEHSDSGHGSSS